MRGLRRQGDLFIFLHSIEIGVLRYSRSVLAGEPLDGVDDLRVPPGNRLEALKGDRKGFWSIRINGQWRIIFRWVNGYAENVEVIDYH